MEGYIQDKGLFKDNPYYENKFPESLTVIENWMKTIQEFREYANPQTSNWDEYFQAVFQILNFQIEKIGSRFSIIKNNGGDSLPNAVLANVRPGESLDSIIPGLYWANMLFFVAKYYNVHWGLIFDGSTMMIHDFKRSDYQYIKMTIQFGRILDDNQIDSFIQVCKVFRAIKNELGKDSFIQKNIPSYSELERLLPELKKKESGATKKEIQVLSLVSQGMTNKEIAEYLGLGEGTTRNYLSSIFGKLKAKNRTEAVKLGKEMGIL